MLASFDLRCRDNSRAARRYNRAEGAMRALARTGAAAANARAAALERCLEAQPTPYARYAYALRHTRHAACYTMRARLINMARLRAAYQDAVRRVFDDARLSLPKRAIAARGVITRERSVMVLLIEISSTHASARFAIRLICCC